MATILVVDDDATILEMICEILEMENHTVYRASNGTDALELANTIEVDILITDLVMPGKAGITVIRALRNKFPNLKTLAMSGADKGGDYLKAAKDFGADALLQKPFRVELFLETIGSLLNK